MRDIEVVIANRGNAQGLWYTIESICIESEATNIDVGFLICTNGEPLDTDIKQILGQLKRAKKLDWHEHFDETLTPQMARQKAIQNSNAPIIFCADNHILVCRDFFNRALLDFEKYNCDFLHSCTRYYDLDVVCYGYKLQMKIDGWGTSETVIGNELKPFKIAAAGHGGFFLKKKSFEELNGYYLSSSFVGYSGEELTHDIGAWMQGKTVWIDPRIEHRHWATTTRGYERHHSENFYKNLFSSTFILTDKTYDEYIYHMLEHFKKCSKPTLKKPLFDILMEAQERSKPYVEWLRNRRLRTFEEQLKYFDDNGVMYK